MNTLKITALLGMAVLLLAPSAGRAAVTLQPASGKALADDILIKPQPVQGSYADPNPGPPPKNAPRKAAPSGPGPGKPNNYAGPGPGRPDSPTGGETIAADLSSWTRAAIATSGRPGAPTTGPGGRPYYGRIIGGIALGTIIGVTAYGLMPPRPDPDLAGTGQTPTSPGATGTTATDRVNQWLGALRHAPAPPAWRTCRGSEPCCRG